MHGNWPAFRLPERRKKGKCDGGGGGIEMIRDSGRTIEVSIDRSNGGGALSIGEKNCDEAPSVRLSHIFYSVADFFLSFFRSRRRRLWIVVI